MATKTYSVCHPYWSGEQLWEVREFDNLTLLAQFVQSRPKEQWRVCNQFNGYPKQTGVYYFSRGKYVLDTHRTTPQSKA